MPLPFLKGRMTPANPARDAEELMQRAKAMFGGEQPEGARGLISDKAEKLRRYDVLSMERVVSILMWGRSGSVLLASYLDGHEDVIMIPGLYGWKLYSFFERYRSLSLRDKLLAYPAHDSEYTHFFDRDFPISPTQYYAAVQAIVEAHDRWPPEFLESRRAFFLLVHIAYNLALGRQPATSNPLIVYAQHFWDDRVAKQLVEDFPQVKFVHTVRDPISSCDSFFHSHLEQLAEPLPYSVLDCLVDRDQPHAGAESRTRGIRFEDLHSDTAGTMFDLADWLGISCQETLLDSTFNGSPYVMSRDGSAWSGRRLAQIQRNSRHLSRKDRALLYALVYENFADWKYTCPTIFRHRAVRCIVFAALLLLPTKMETDSARAIWKGKILPSLRRGNILDPIKSAARIGFCRLKMIRLMLSAFVQRCAGGTALLQVGQKMQRPEPGKAGAQVVGRSEMLTETFHQPDQLQRV